MAVPCNAGFVEMAKLGVGTGSAAVFKYIALGTGTGQGGADTALSAETAVSGLTRADATEGTATTTIADDTMQVVHTFTAGGAAHIKEAGWFNAASAGDMLMVGDLSPSANLAKDDTLKVTLQNQVKAGS